MKSNNQPDYKRIYTDMISRKYPHKKESCEAILKKKRFSTLDVITINNMIFGKGQERENTANQLHRSYDKAAIIEMLQFQKKNNMNNSQLSRHTKLSRNTIIKWKKLFVIN
ncbi:helix-turn-helix domain-containing protein [Chryseobacterium sp. PBS4-4]|uniref:Helix-turn-helix domain-containing protein n=1 Tax=Chryseobacterium edaphi TaxID=2976532 RepID=A0ABT2W0P7_9FLAO|nr:helix-turn-helix domain-containing protein [Chryseobacterium edaphi]MCU7615819.1 helix-turn-helix domain-containing protein [Chryseobacterium edaphi]